MADGEQVQVVAWVGRQSEIEFSDRQGAMKEDDGKPILVYDLCAFAVQDEPREGWWNVIALCSSDVRVVVARCPSRGLAELVSSALDRESRSGERVRVVEGEA